MFKAVIMLLRRKTSIRFRIWLMASSLLLLLYGASLAALLSHLKDVKKEKLENITFVVSEVLPEVASKALLYGKRDDLRSLIEHIVNRTDIQSVVVSDHEQNVFLTSHTPDEQLPKIKATIIREQLNPDFDGFELDTETITSFGRKYGEIEAYYDQAGLSSLALQAIVRSSFWLFLSLLVSIPLVYVLTMSLTQPLSGIMNKVALFKKGKFKTEPKKEGFLDEYAELSAALADAGKHIQKQQKQLEQQISKSVAAHKEADEANAKKDILIANMTHEMKTPLGGIESALHLTDDILFNLLNCIDEHQAPDVIKKKLFQSISTIELAKVSQKDINRVVNQILYSIQEVYDDFQIEESEFDITEKLEKLFSNHKMFAENKGLTLGWTCPQEPVWVLADWIRIAETLNTLISNAIQFTNNGRIDIAVHLLKIQNEISLSVEIQDTGTGIVESEKNRIFSLFHIAEEPSKKEASGIGTGLAIASRICKKLGARISLKSTQLGKGSIFSFDIMLKRGTEKPPALSGLQSPAEQIKVLHVEDSLVTQMLFKQYCQEENISVVVAGNGKEGFQKYLNGHFDLLIVDCYMPICNGYEFAGLVRQHEKRENSNASLLIALTAHDSEKNRQLCLSAGFDHFLTKPIKRRHFELMKTWYRTRKNRPRIVVSNEFS